MLDKLFGRKKTKAAPQPAPEISFGRYSDNNKSVSKVNRWTEAENLFKERKFPESFDAFFDYIRDETQQNVRYERTGPEGRFECYQGSKIVRGQFDARKFCAEVTLARMPQPSVPVMRRLLEMNFSLYYSRFALDSERLCMRFDSDVQTANPSKLYYGLKELATKGDKQDDLLVQDFSILQTTDIEHLFPLPQHEREVKYEWFQKWIKETLDAVAALDADKFSGGIAYLLLNLAYKIDYLLSPEGKLLHDLENISYLYFKKDDRPIVEKNRDMTSEFKKLQSKSKEDIFQYLFRSRHTFAITSPQPYKTIADAIRAANDNGSWYRDNNYHFIGTQIAEYGIAYCQYSYSLPRVVTELFHLLMTINYVEYFLALGYTEVYYDHYKNQFAISEIIQRIKDIQEPWKSKYPLMNFNTQNVKFDSLLNFNLSFTNELAALNMEGK